MRKVAPLQGCRKQGLYPYQGKEGYMKKSFFRKAISCVASAALATAMVPAVGGGVALADTATQGELPAWWTSYVPAAAASTNGVLTTYGVRAGSAGPDYLGISNTNFDFTDAKAKSNYQFYGYGNYATDSSKLAGLAIWGSTANEAPNPYYANLFYNIMNHYVGTGTSAVIDGRTEYVQTTSEGYVANAATTWSKNLDSTSWGDTFTGAKVLNADGTSSDADTPGLTGTTPDIVFGATKTVGWGGDYKTGTNFYNAGLTSATYTNNDATNIWTQIYTLGELAQEADAKATASSKTTRYGTAVSNAANYEKAIRGNLLYIASCIENQPSAKKTVAYLYSVDGNNATFFVPQASELVSGNDAGEAINSSTLEDYAGTNAVANDDYAANNGTIDLGYMDVLPFITNTFTNESTESTLDLTVEDICKANPICTIGADDMTTYTESGEIQDEGILAGVDVIIYNTDKTKIDAAPSNDAVEEWAAAYGFSGRVVAGDDFSTSTKQERLDGGTEDGQSPLLYCQRNYTADKNARAAWAFAQVYPELYDGNPDATYAYWVDKIYHITCKTEIGDDGVAVTTNYVPAVVKYMENKSSEVVYTPETAESIESKICEGWCWWNSKTPLQKNQYARWYSGSSRASFYDENAGAEPDGSVEGLDKIGIFETSSLWNEEVTCDCATTHNCSLCQTCTPSLENDSLGAQSLSAQADEEIEGYWGGCRWVMTQLEEKTIDVAYEWAVDVYPMTDEEQEDYGGCANGVYPESPGAYYGKTVTKPSSLTNSDWFRWFYYSASKNCNYNAVTTIRIHEGVTSVGYMANVDHLTSWKASGNKFTSNFTFNKFDPCCYVELPKSLKSIDMTGLFWGCYVNSAGESTGYVDKMTLTIGGVSKEVNESSLAALGGNSYFGLDCDAGQNLGGSDQLGVTVSTAFAGNEVVVPDATKGTFDEGSMFGSSTIVTYAPTADKAEAAKAEQAVADAKAACEKAGIAYDENKTAAENLAAADAAVAQKAAEDKDAAVASAQEQAAKEACQKAGVAYDESKTATENMASAYAAIEQAQAKASAVPVAQKIFAKVAKKTYKAKNLKKKAASFKIGAMAMTGLTYKVTKKASNKISVSKAGKVTLKKGAKKGTYKVTVTAAGNATYKAATKVITIKVK